MPRRVIRVIMGCRGCGAESVDKAPAMEPDGRVKFSIEIAHGDLCPHMRRVKQESVIDLD